MTALQARYQELKTAVQGGEDEPVPGSQHFVVEGERGIGFAELAQRGVRAAVFEGVPVA